MPRCHKMTDWFLIASEGEKSWSTVSRALAQAQFLLANRFGERAKSTLSCCGFYGNPPRALSSLHTQGASDKTAECYFRSFATLFFFAIALNGSLFVKRDSSS